ncbi:MAG: isochorismatase family cysteine hydrolase [Beijerinckiaceae bacterium]|nr:isochorismatase family cysteine hydrolase [Beijerinckiaceae bacterium]
MRAREARTRRPRSPRNPALIVVDVTYAFTGVEGQTLEESIAEFITAAGPLAWRAMPRIVQLIDAFRAGGHPVVFTRSAPANTPFVGRSTKSKKVPPAMSERDNTIPPCIAPLDHEWVLGKERASAFFQTTLPAYLIKRNVDTVAVCGVSTSGCVRATVADSYSHGYETWIVSDACFDRSQFLHGASLFDMQRQFGSVLEVSEVEPLLATQPAL